MKTASPTVLRIVTHSKKVLRHATRLGWLPGARYTNLRDVRTCKAIGFLDIDWRDYDFERHLAAAEEWKPLLTVARDVEQIGKLDEILRQADKLAEHAKYVIVVPKARVPWSARRPDPVSIPPRLQRSLEVRGYPNSTGG